MAAAGTPGKESNKENQAVASNNANDTPVPFRGDANNQGNRKRETSKDRRRPTQHTRHLEGRLDSRTFFGFGIDGAIHDIPILKKTCAIAKRSVATAASLLARRIGIRNRTKVIHCPGRLTDNRPPASVFSGLRTLTVLVFQI
jgi:hypothetical protein